MTLNPTCKRVETIEGVPLTVTGVAQVKVLSDEQILALACEQFLDLDIDRIQNTILQTLEGHLRAILGTLTVEAIYKVGLITCSTHCVYTPLHIFSPILGSRSIRCSRKGGSGSRRR